MMAERGNFNVARRTAARRVINTTKAELDSVFSVDDIDLLHIAGLCTTARLKACTADELVAASLSDALANRIQQEFTEAGCELFINESTTTVMTDQCIFWSLAESNSILSLGMSFKMRVDLLTIF